MRPLPFKFSNKAVVLGHYMIGQRSGSLAATIGALTLATGANGLARVRWPTNSFGASFVLTRLRIGITVDGAVTTATEFSAQAVIARNFSVDYGTAITNISMVSQCGAMSPLMTNGSLMGATGPGIGTTAVMSGQTLAGDAAPFAMATFTNPSSTLGASAVTIQVGAGVPMTDLYNWQQLGGYPPELGPNMGIVVGLKAAGPASGTFGFYTEWSWAEVINPFGMA